MEEGLLKDVRNYLDITYPDEETDRKLSGIIERGRAYLDNMAGASQDYEAEALPVPSCWIIAACKE